MEQRRDTRVDLTDEGWSANLNDQVSGNPLGQVVNLSRGGVMIITPLPVESDTLYQVELAAVGPDGQNERFSVGVLVLWRTTAGRPGSYWAGLQIIDIDAATRSRLDEFTARLTATG